MSQFLIKSKGEIKWIEFEHFSKIPEIFHFSSLRTGGNSSSPQYSLNLGFTEFDLPENVIQNRKLFSNAIGIPFDSLIYAEQTHSKNISFVSKNDLGRGLYDEYSEFKDFDGFVFKDKEICPVVQSADCVPVLLYEPEKKIAATVHSGWKGTAQRISTYAIEEMKKLGANTSKILASIGPSAGVCCYEIKNDVLDVFVNNFGEIVYTFIKQNGEKIFLDLWKINKYILENSGIKSQNIIIADICTICNPDKFFSARFGKGKTGRMISGIYIKV